LTKNLPYEFLYNKKDDSVTIRSLRRDYEEELEKMRIEEIFEGPTRTEFEI